MSKNKVENKDISKLEAEFERLADSVGETIKNKIMEAQKLLGEACALSDQHGIPFWTNISELGQPYVPYSFRDMWGELDYEFVTNVTEVLEEDLYNSRGWNTSSIC